MQRLLLRMICAIPIISVFFLLLLSCQKEEIIEVTQEAELDKIIDSEFKRFQMPGLACLAVKNDSIVYQKFSGYANRKENIPFTNQTRMIIASISKTITLTAIMQLYEKGFIDLDEDINTYLPFKVRNPNFPNSKITVRMLLTHTSSISDGGYSVSTFYLFGYVDYPESLMSFEQNYLTSSGKYNSKKNYSKNKPGEVYDYSNIGAALIGCILEHITDISFNEYCKTNIFKPLGMDKTTWFFSETPKDEVAIPYSDNKVSNPSNPFFTYPTYPDGHLITTIEDLSKFMRAYMLDGTFNGYQLLQKQTVDIIFTENLNDHDMKQGLIFFEIEIGEYKVWGHDGGDPGISTEMYFNKEEQIGYIMFNNRYLAYSRIIGSALLNYSKQF